MSPAYHSSACILSTGDEVTLGQIVDANAAWLADALTGAGVLPVEQATVPDDATVIRETVARLARRSPLVVMSGGLGPTDADLTRVALAALVDEEVVVDEAALRALTDMLARRNRTMTDRQARQAMRPRSAHCLPNPNGTAAGLHVTVPAARTGAAWDTDVFCLPGPPRELQPMFMSYVVPALRTDPAISTQTRLLHVLAVPESDAATRLAHLTRRDPSPGEPLLAMTASGGILTLRARIQSRDSALIAGAKLDALEQEVRAILGSHVMGGRGRVGARGEAALASGVIQLLRERDRTLGVGESCTGGMLGELVTSIAGSSGVFLGGCISYANEMKVKALGVEQGLLEAHGAVSEPVARAMALGALRMTGATDALSVTGIAGPEGGSDAKPVGTVFIAHASRDGVQDREPRCDVRRFLFTGDRHDVRQRAAISGLSMVYFAHAVGGASASVRMNWQVG